MSQQSIIKKLNEFLVHNREIDLLEAELREFNPLKILKIEHFEIRHSNVLAWLLDPRENHGLGEAFLKKLLVRIWIENERIKFPITITEILNSSFYDAQVLREFGFTDILIFSKSNNIGFLIENKIHSKERKGQIERYIKRLKGEFSSVEIIPILLTLDDLGSDEEERDYSGLNYEHVYDILTHLMQLYGKGLNTRVADFIRAYLETLEVLTMQDKSEVVQLCKEIYRLHKEAVDAIIEYGIRTSYDEAIDEFLKGKLIQEACRNGRAFWFLPEVLFKKAPKFNLGWKSPYPISFWFKFSQNKIGLILEVGPFSDPEKRLSFVKEINNASYFKVYKEAFRPESKYTRIYSEYLKYDEWDDTEQLVATMNKLYEKAKEAEKHLALVMDKFKW